MPHLHTPMPSLPVVTENSYTYMYTHYPVSTVRFQSDHGPRGGDGRWERSITYEQDAMYLRITIYTRYYLVMQRAQYFRTLYKLLLTAPWSPRGVRQGNPASDLSSSADEKSSLYFSQNANYLRTLITYSQLPSRVISGGRC